MNLSCMVQNSELIISQEDFILVDYALFFNSELGIYNKFSIDNEKEIAELKKIIKKCSRLDKNIKVYVCAYSYKLTNRDGEKSIYADCIWLDTEKDITQIENLFEDNRSIQPSDISLLHETEEYYQNCIYLFSNDGRVVNLRENCAMASFDHVKVLYWD